MTQDFYSEGNCVWSIVRAVYRIIYLWIEYLYLQKIQLGFQVNVQFWFPSAKHQSNSHYIRGNNRIFPTSAPFTETSLKCYLDGQRSERLNTLETNQSVFLLVKEQCSRGLL